MGTRPTIKLSTGEAQWWVWHNTCTLSWFAGPFATDQAAHKFLKPYIGTDSCPGCGQSTPQASDYNIAQM